MAGYRIYFIDENEHVRGAVDVSRDHDAISIPPARELLDAVAIELWKPEGFLCRFERLSP